MTREEMMNNIINKYGFEAPQTIGFCKTCEDYEISNYEIAFIYCLLMR